ncbi:MAG: recombination enhancement function domain protein [Pseudomonadales bacterium]|nr:recombination enhancement function domain protein [Pseudomonadales bacterium]
MCCLNKGWIDSTETASAGLQYISLHHIDGRTKPGAHAKILPLCRYHHQVQPPNQSYPDLFPIHGSSKHQWEDVNGTEQELLTQCYGIINEPPPA